MNPTPSPLALNTAMSQDGRRLHAPAPRRVRVDGRSLAELLGFAAEYGALINFYDLANQPDGDWSAFFLANQSTVLALRASLDLPGIEAELGLLRLALVEATAAARLAHWQALAPALLRLAQVLAPEARAARGFAQALGQLAAATHTGVLAEQARLLSDLCAGERPAQQLARADPDPAWLGSFHATLEAFCEALGAALELAHVDAVARLDASLFDQTHPPQAGLWDAFAHLFGHAQASLNRFPARLLAFYQSAVLRQDSRAGRPDQVILCFSLADGAPPVALPRGAGFLAGSAPDGQSIVYALDADLEVDASSVGAMRTLTLARHAPLPHLPPVPSQVLSGEVALQPSAPAIGAPFPMFGANTPGVHGALGAELASMGFALASSCFLMAGGLRQVRLGLTLAPAGAARVGADLATLAPGTAAPVLLAVLLEHAFTLAYSSADGWVEIAHYRVSAPAAADAPYLLSFQLSADAAPWAPCPDGAGAAPGPRTALPTLEARLRQAPFPFGPQGWPLFPYAWLAALALSALTIEVNVGALAALEVDGPAGPVDASQAFAVFGSPPVQYASLGLRSPELFAKRLSCFSMSIEWIGLPVAHTGFQGYYEAYVINANGQTQAPGTLFDNDSFSVALDVVNPGRWALQASPAAQLLFQCDYQTDTTPPPLLPVSVLSKQVLACQPGDYYDPALSYVRVRLASPDYAFGDVLYAPNVMAASLRLSATAAACAGQCAKPRWGAQAAARLDGLGAAGAADERALAGRIAQATQQALADLDGAALDALDAAIARAEPARREDWRASLAAALAAGPGRAARRWLAWRRATDQDAVHARLRRWLDEHAQALADASPAELAQARALLDAGDGALALRERSAQLAPAAARTVLAGGVQGLQTGLREADERACKACIDDCIGTPDAASFPNQPWLPLAKSVRVNYGAFAQLPLADAQDDSAFFHLCPFERRAPVAWAAGASVPLLMPLDQSGALYIELAKAGTALSLLFELAPPAAGWPAITPALTWSVAGADGAWHKVPPQRDGTQDMRQSGLVKLDLADHPAGAPLALRIGFTADADAALFPLLAGLASNAATATWQGPGGADRLGLPLAPGSIGRALAPLPGIGAIAQPLASSGGRPRASGTEFDLWLAERLRHKDYGVQAWDYASLVLDAFPTLWQAGVVPASAGGAQAAPGHVWIVAVPGPDTPLVADPSIPANDAQVLGDIAAYLAPRISPFIELTVSNPPYVRLTVHAQLLFKEPQAAQACLSRLNQELIDFLSPWPTPALGVRPANYYTRLEVVRFVRQRPYVRAILALRIEPEPKPVPGVHYYFTSAATHQLALGETAPGASLPAAPRLVPAIAAGGTP